MRQLFNNLAARERRLIVWGGSGLLAALFYAWGWQPIWKERQALRAALPTLQANARQMDADAQEVARLRASAQSAPSGTTIQATISAAIQQASRESGLSSEALQITPLDPQHASLKLEPVTLDQWNALTVALSGNARIRVENCLIEPSQKPGMVKVTAQVSSGER